MIKVAMHLDFDLKVALQKPYADWLVSLLGDAQKVDDVVFCAKVKGKTLDVDKKIGDYYKELCEVVNATINTLGEEFFYEEEKSKSLIQQGLSDFVLEEFSFVYMNKVTHNTTKRFFKQRTETSYTKIFPKTKEKEL